MRPRPADYAFDLAAALEAVVTVTSHIPPDGLTASVLGTERSGNGVVIERNLVLTIGYLVTEAQQIWLTLSDGRTVPGDVLAYDQPTGFGLIQALGQMDVTPVTIGSSTDAGVGDEVVISGAGGLQNALAAHLVAKQEFAGYWEYLLDEALFVAPAHQNWGGTAVLAADGSLIGIGSLQIQDAEVNGDTEDLNMVVPIDLLKPILADMKQTGASGTPPRPWMGLYATASEDSVVVIGLSERGPAQDAGVEPGDVITAVDGTVITSLPEFFRAVWSTGPAGCAVTLSMLRDGQERDAVIVTVDRGAMLKRPMMH
ncbi:MAG: S1C family serine protease [Pseudomonadota bacterium]